MHCEAIANSVHCLYSNPVLPWPHTCFCVPASCARVDMCVCAEVYVCVCDLQLQVVQVGSEARRVV